MNKLKDFIGVFSANELDFLIDKNNFSLIVNSNENTDFSIGHFITIIVKKFEIIYIDSFGIKCANKKILQFMESLERPIRFNNQQIQHIFSNYCGLYAILFILYYDKKNIRKKIKLYFVKRFLKKNDVKCLKFIKKLIK